MSPFFLRFCIFYIFFYREIISRIAKIKNFSQELLANFFTTISWRNGILLDQQSGVVMYLPWCILPFPAGVPGQRFTPHQMLGL
jgi:hypothetical protein